LYFNALEHWSWRVASVERSLGHSTVGITLDVYSHVLPGMQEEAARRIDSALRKAIENQHRPVA
jgi:integrase